MNDEKPNGNGENFCEAHAGTVDSDERIDGTIRNDTIGTHPDDDNRLLNTESRCTNKADGRGRMTKEEYQEMRRKAYNTMGWRRLRKYHLSQHPICEKCWADKGIINPGTPEHPLHIHHIKSPFSSSGVNMDLLLDDANLMTVCGECHGLIHNNPKVVNKVLMDKLDTLLPMD